MYVLIEDCDDGESILTVYVGRSIISLRDRLAEHLDEASYFAFVELDSEEEAFELECRLFHEYGKAKHLDNRVHPARPPGRSDLPVCSELGCDGEPD